MKEALSSHPAAAEKITTNAVLYPAITEDYTLKVDEKLGLGLVANRNIRKGTLVLKDSFEFMFTDVSDCTRNGEKNDNCGEDYLLFDGAARASHRSKTKIPDIFPITKDMLLKTHGVPTVNPDITGKTAGNIVWRLEIPGMLMNHSCDPNVYSKNKSKGKDETAEDYAARDIRKGEALTWDYTVQFYDRGPFFDECLCGAESCRSKMRGFKDLSEEDKVKIFPNASKAVQVMYLADIGEGLSVTYEQDIFPERSLQTLSSKSMIIPRLVFPGPSASDADVIVKQNANGIYKLYASRNFSFGDLVYDYFRRMWPFEGKQPIDYVFSASFAGGDPVEGTIVRINPHHYASKNRSGKYMFSGFDLFSAHSCNPNLAPNEANENPDDDWHSVYAARDIIEGEELTFDFNSIFWDRSKIEGTDTCSCGSTKCVGTIKGFKYLTSDKKEERKLMTWRRVGPPYKGEKEKDTHKLGAALSPHVRLRWRTEERKNENWKRSAPDSDWSISSSSDED